MGYCINCPPDNPLYTYQTISINLTHWALLKQDHQAFQICDYLPTLLQLETFQSFAKRGCSVWIRLDPPSFSEDPISWIVCFFQAIFGLDVLLSRLWDSGLNFQRI